MVSRSFVPLYHVWMDRQGERYYALRIGKIKRMSFYSVFLKKLKVRTKILLKCIAYNFRLMYNNFVNIRLLLCCERAIL